MNSFVIREFSNLDIKKNSILTVGKFDGIHKGHQKLLSYVAKEAKRNNLISIAIICSQNVTKLYSEESNIEYIKSLGINYVIVIDFSEKFYKMDSDSFLSCLVKYYNMSYIVVGEDFKFGRNREGDINTIIDYSKTHDIKCKIMGFSRYNGDKISTTSIKNYLANGDMKTVSKMLSRLYSISGIVETGKQIGRTIGYPTANLYMPEYMLMPKEGVYYGLVKIKNFDSNYTPSNEFEALVFVGSSNINKGLRLEAHILNFDDDLYGKEIEVFLLKYKRENIKIESIEHLKTIIKKDELNTIKFFKRRKVCLLMQRTNQK